jgi:hypothetical protein
MTVSGLLAVCSGGKELGSCGGWVNFDIALGRLDIRLLGCDVASLGISRRFEGRGLFIFRVK